MLQSKHTSWLLLPLWVGFTALMMWFGFKWGLSQALAVVVAIPIAIFFANNPKIHLMACIILFNSGLRVPGIWFDVNFFQLATFLYFCLAILRFAMTKQGIDFRGAVPVLLLLFSLNILTVMYFQGAGFRFLGDENWGGMRYVNVFIIFAFFYTIHSVPLSEKQWLTTLYSFTLISTLPFLAEAVYVLSNGVVYYHYFLFEFASRSNLSLSSFLTDSGGLVRFQSALKSGETLVYLGIALTAIHKKHWHRYLLIIILGLGLIGFSGHRIGILRSGMVSILFFLIYYKNSRKKVIFNYTLCFLTIIALAYLFAQNLPKNFQRALAFLPGINIDASAAFDAQSTSSWRLNVWNFALGEIPDYLVLGKGYTYPAFIEDLLYLQRQSGIWNHEAWAIETVAYHNGFFSLIIGLGLSGLLLGAALLATICWRYYQPCRLQWDNAPLKVFYTTFYSLLVVNILFFFTIYGDFHVSVPNILFLTAVLEGLRTHHLSNNPAGIVGTSAAEESQTILPSPPKRIRV